ncbi:hypothetical protein U27_05444 [Candidatus Vecturithrix granuli]|uniref:Uncharacterized protein n=1 Tax=Vecturithrix granuli TaxID=1499967 RepID=A0A081C1L5_VECG1|nr:hypothetical protein U27_05444 [Candidatus Vecturithrix granuli]
MQNIGKGFAISIEAKKNILRTRAWGQWDTNFANTYREAILEKIQEIRASGNRWNILADFRDFFPQTPDVWNVVMQQFVMTKDAGISNIVYLGNQETSILREGDRVLTNGMIFEQEVEAVAWLLQDTPPTH